jgi:DNA-binding response OmpR family regulator
MNLLLIEDDSEIADILNQSLAVDYRVERKEKTAAGIEKAISGHYSVIVCDVKTQGSEALQFCKSVREHGITCPILIICGETNILRKIEILDAGADDYLLKPFSLGELKARLRVMTRRVYGISNGHQLLSVNDLTMHLASRRVVRNGMDISLRKKEYALLEYLLQHLGQVVTRRDLAKYAWRPTEKPWANTVDVHIKYLRDKVDRPFTSPLIKTVHGLGYKIEA